MSIHSFQGMSTNVTISVTPGDHVHILTTLSVTWMIIKKPPYPACVVCNQGWSSRTPGPAYHLQVRSNTQCTPPTGGHVGNLPARVLNLTVKDLMLVAKTKVVEIPLYQGRWQGLLLKLHRGNVHTSETCDAGFKTPNTQKWVRFLPSTMHSGTESKCRPVLLRISGSYPDVYKNDPSSRPD
jgi:hypothetical protein